MITPILRNALEPIVTRQRLLRLLRSAAIWFLALTAIVVALRFAGFNLPALVVMMAAAAGLWECLRRANRWEPAYRTIAREIEEKHPELHALLLTAVEQEPDRVTGKLSFLQQRVLAETVAHAQKQQWIDAVPGWKIGTAGTAAIVALGLLAVFGRSTPVAAPTTTTRVEQPKHDGVEVTPGDVAIERGSGLVVLATFGAEVPSEATLVIEPQNEPVRRLTLVKNLDDPVFGGSLPEVDADLTYRVEYSGQATRDFSVHVFEHPRLERTDATLHYPDYTKLPEKKVPDTRRVSAVEGTKIDLSFLLNKPVKSATLVGKDGARVPLAVEEGQPAATLRDFSLRTSQVYELHLEDADGRANKVPAQFTIEALPNRRPELKFATPKGDQRVSPIEEVAFRTQAWDDFGLARYGLTLNVAGRGEQQIELGRDSGTDERREVQHLLKLEEIGVKPDELVSWFLWAEDTGPDGKLRRTASDMFFGEVRPFEEIYRPGDSQEGGSSQPQQGGGAGEQATKLAELQKQIISATWNLKRAEDAAPKSPTEKYLKDAPVVRDSQSDALEQAAALAENIDEPKSLALVENATREMQRALDQLKAAADKVEPLPEALGAEQAAYNALLKLAAHEFRVSRSPNSSSSASAQQRARQQQLDQLDLKEEKQRYETKRQAEPMQNEQQREQLAILNRLKELAQRQQDINEKLKELQTSLQAAQSEKEKEEIKRQLKRLREEEQQLLADLDETRQKMEQSSQQAQLADERRKLDETRSEAQQAAEAMEKSAPSQALASGTRAARQLQEMRDDFRKKTSGQFNDEMRQMRSDAREMAQNQQEIADQLKAESARPQRRTLDGSSEREQLTQRFEKQQGSLGEITEQMKRVSEQAEAAEPLLAKELYDTLRKTAQADTGKKLALTQQLAQRGYSAQAQKFEEKAREEIDELKTGVERAAESVLGDEAEALRQARAELDRLTEELNREIAKARPDLADAGQRGKAESGERRAETGERKPESGQPGQQGQQGQGQQGQGQQGQGQQGQGQQGQGQQGQGQQGQGQQGQGQQGQGQQGQGQQGQGQQGQGQQGQGQQGQGQQGQGQQGQGQQGQGQQGQGQGGDGNAQEGSGSRNVESPGRQAGARLRDLATAPRNTGANRGGRDDPAGLGSGPTGGEQTGPLTGEDFAGWSDRLRNVEEMVDDAAIRSEVARVRELAKGVRVEFKRHSVQPNWEMVKTKIGTPLTELRQRVSEELARRQSKENLVPIDRDPVPTKYAERVRRYYEELGRSK